jgi:hypothetical protein
VRCLCLTSPTRSASPGVRTGTGCPAYRRTSQAGRHQRHLPAFLGTHPTQYRLSEAVSIAFLIHWKKDPINVFPAKLADRSWEYINRPVSFLEIVISNFRYSVFEVYNLHMYIKPSFVTDSVCKSHIYRTVEENMFDLFFSEGPFNSHVLNSRRQNLFSLIFKWLVFVSCRDYDNYGTLHLLYKSFPC